MNLFRKALLKNIVLSAVTVVSAGFAVRVLGAVFPDVTEDMLYYPYIKTLYSQHLIGGDVRTGTFRPKDIITRAELAKAVTYIRLAEEHGIADGWNRKDGFGMAFAVFDLLKPYFGCGQGACASIGGVPFADVPESDPKCMDKLDDSEACEPWFSRYVYYAVSRGLIKGYVGTDGKRYFRPLDPMKRIYALKIMLTDDGSVEPSYDKRFRKLEALADSRDSYSPKCIIGAEEFIKTNGGGNTSEAKRLLEYAVLADRLDLFGNDCRVFTVNGAVTAKQKADFLWKSVKREEVPRYLSLTTSYLPASADPVTDTTVNSASENKGKPASFEYDKSKTVTDGGVTENVNGDTAVKTGTGKAKETAISADTDAVIPDNGITGTTVKAEKGITLTDENGKSCGTIPAGTEFGLLAVRKGSDGKYRQYTDYDGFRLCGFPCSVMMTPGCREAVGNDEINGNNASTFLTSKGIAMSTNIMTDSNEMKCFFSPQKCLDMFKNVKIKTEKIECTDNTIKKIINNFMPCGETETNTGLRVLIPSGLKECSYADDKNKKTKWSLCYAGIVEGDDYWNSLANYTQSKMSECSIQQIIKKSVDSKKSDRNKTFNPEIEKYVEPDIVDLTGVYDLTYGSGTLIPKYIILHRTDSSTAISPINSWTPAFFGSENKLATPSVHYLIDKNGTIYKISDDSTVRWHTGTTSKKKDVKQANAIGIEVVGYYHRDSKKWDNLTNAQMRAISQLTLKLVNKYNIQSGNICPHEKISYKQDDEGGLYSPIVINFIKSNKNEQFAECKTDLEIKLGK